MADKSEARKNIKKLLEAKQDRKKYLARIDRAIEEYEKRTEPLKQIKPKEDRFKLVSVFHSDDPAELERVGVAETPTLVSPYIREKRHCPECDKDYGPLFYGVGHTTESAHHDIIYTTKDEPVEQRIRGGGALLSGSITEDERAFTTERAHYLACSRCSRPDTEGTITTKGYVSCSECARETHPIEWSTEDGGLHFMFKPGHGPSQQTDRYLKGQEEVSRMQQESSDPFGDPALKSKLDALKRKFG